jgi:hypothetical protein
MRTFSAVPNPFFIGNQGDGWWHCPSPIVCTILDGPDICGGLVARWPDDTASTFWLVETALTIEWNGDMQFAARWGEDHPLCHPIEPTNRALVMAKGHSDIDLNRAFGVPAYPTRPDARSLADAEPLIEVGAKVTVYRGKPPR